MSAALDNHLNDIIHAIVVVVVVIAATILGAAGQLDKNTIGNVYLAVVGYAAGRAGPAAVRTVLSRSTDNID